MTQRGEALPEAPPRRRVRERCTAFSGGFGPRSAQLSFTTLDTALQLLYSSTALQRSTVYNLYNIPQWVTTTTTPALRNVRRPKRVREPRRV